MVFQTRWWMKYLAAPALVAGSALTVRAEQDFEFAKKLLDNSSPSFVTEDLVEHLIAQLDQNAATKTESKLIKATYKRKMAVTASTEKRRELLDEADALYKEVLADKNYKNREVAEREAGTINSARISSTIRAANEIAKTNPGEAKKLRADAAAQLEKIAAGFKADSDAKRPPFDEAYKKYETWNEKENPNFDKPIPPEILQPMGKAFDAWLIPHQKYVATRIEQLECYDEADPAKKTLSAELSKLCGETAEGKGVADFPVLVAWYNYMKGRSFAAIGDEKNAAEAWNDALASGNPEEMPPQQKRAFLGIKKLILTDLVKMKMRAKKYGDVESIVVEARRDNSLRVLFTEDAGKGLIIDYAKALTLPEDAQAGEYERAVKTLREMIVAEKTSTAWANEFSRTIAEVLDEMRRNKPLQRPKLSASEWYDAARGFFILAQNDHRKFTELEKEKSPKTKDQYEIAYANFRSAVEYYRRAISEARKEKTPLAERLEVEPKSWFEMGLSYIKMRHYYEAVIANSAFRDSYMPDDRKRWMPDITKPAYRQQAKQLSELLAEIDKPKTGFLDKAGSNMMYALEQNLAVNKNPQDLWNRELKPLVLRDLQSEGFDDGGVTDAEYITAKNDMDTASSLSKASAQLKDPKVIEENYAQSLEKYVGAAEKFKKVKTGSPAYELALYQIGSAYTMAQALWVTNKIPSRHAEGPAKAKELGEKALAAFNVYDEHIKKAPVKEEADKTRRLKLEGTILLARNSLYSGAGQWEEVIKSADAYVAWEQKNPQPKTQQGVALMNKFRANLELAAANPVPKCDPYLANAEKTMRAWRKVVTDNKVFKFMLNALARRNNIAAAQVKFFVEQGKSEYNLDMTEPYELKMAYLQKERLTLLEDAEDENPTLDDYSRIVYLMNKIGAHKEAVDAAKKLLATFDPENSNNRIPDEPKVWQDLLGRMNQIISYDDLAKRDRARADHKVLIDRMYDTAEGNNAPNQDARPEFDKVKEDAEQAMRQIDTIKKNYQNCQTMVDPKTNKPYSQFVPALNEWVAAYVEKYPKMKDLKGKAFLQVVEEEVDYRLKIVATREVLSTLSLKLAQKARQEKDEALSNQYFEIANTQIKILSDLKGDTPALKNQRASIEIVLGKYPEALQLLQEVKITVPDGSVPYFNASKRISEVFALQKEWVKAAEYPTFMALTIGFSAPIVKDNWPDMKLFLKECFDNGVPVPPQLTKAMETLNQPKDEEKKDEQPKADEAPKTDAPKTETPKADAEATKEATK